MAEKMEWHVWWDQGSCNEGSHNCGLEHFETLEAARKFVAEKKEYDSDCLWAIIRGEVVEEE